MAALSSSSSSNCLSFFPVKPPLPHPLPQRVVFLAGRGFSPLAIAQEQGLESVMNPAAANSNALYFSGYNVQVVVDDNEPEERLVNRFRREVMRAGVIQESKRRRFFENKQEEKKRRTREAAKRNRKRRPQFRGPDNVKPDESTSKRNADDEDNWDLRLDDIPS